MDKERLQYLIDRFKTSQISSEELEELDYWYNTFEATSNSTDKLSPQHKEDKRNRIWKKIIQQEDIAKTISPKSRVVVRLIQSSVFKAAVLIIIVGLSLYFNNNRDLSQSQPDSKFTLLKDIQPGGNNATLVLSDGTIFDLKALKDGGVIEKPGLTVTKTEDGVLTYTSMPNLADNDITNTINTPRGGQYKINLPDGTKVWLNAASSLTYPSQFTAKERRVELSGEAYFEVASQVLTNSKGNSKIPFIVKTQNQEVEVIGTHFNVKAYNDDNDSETTLLEGKVKVVGYSNGVKSNEEKILNVGQSAIWNNGKIVIEAVNTEKAIAWKDGKFAFSGENIKDLMSNISRWYNVEVAYDGDVSEVNFEGSISRYETISEVLRKLELTGTVHFKIVPIENELGQERRIIVMP